MTIACVAARPARPEKREYCSGVIRAIPVNPCKSDIAPTARASARPRARPWLLCDPGSSTPTREAKSFRAELGAVKNRKP